MINQAARFAGDIPGNYDSGLGRMPLQAIIFSALKP